MTTVVIGRRPGNAGSLTSTYIDSSNATQTPYGFGVMTVGNNAFGGGSTQHGMLRFDLSSIPTNATITSATLTLQAQSVNAGPYTLTFAKLLRPWVQSQTSWNNYSTGNAWQTAGASGAADLSASSWNSSSISTAAGSDVAISGASLIADLQAWVTSPATNFGWRIRGATNLAYVQFYNAAADSRSIQLSVTYTVPGRTSLGQTLIGLIPGYGNPGTPSGMPDLSGLATGVNMSACDYYTPETFPFIDIVHCTSQGWTGAGVTTGADGYVSTITSGSSGSKFIVLGADKTYSLWRSGRYVVEWTPQAGLGYTVQSTASTSGITQVSPGRMEFDLAALSPATADGYVQLIVSNSSGSTITGVGKVSMFHIDDEADFNAGKIWNSTVKNSFIGIPLVRFMGVMNTNDDGSGNGGGQQASSSDIPTLTSCNWVTGGLPYEAIGAFVAEMAALGQAVVPWITPQHKLDFASFTTLAQRLATTLPSASRVVLEYSNELWNTFGQGAWVMNNRSSGLTFYKSDGTVTASPTNNEKMCAAIADVSCEIYARFEAVLGRTRVIRCFGNQAAVFSALSTALQYIDPRSGKRFKDIIDWHAIAPYFQCWDIASSYLTALGLPTADHQRDVVSRRDYLQNDAYWTNLYQASINANKDWVAATLSGLQAIGFKGQLVSYELGNQDGMTLFGYTTDNAWQVTVNTGTNRLVRSGTDDLSTAFANGERIMFSYPSTAPNQLPTHNVPTIGDQGWSAIAYVKLNGTTDLELYTDVGLTNRITLVAGSESSYWVISYDRLYATQARIKAFLDSAAGVQVYKNHRTALLQAGLANYTHFTNVGLYFGGDKQSGVPYLRYAFQWGARQSYWMAAGPASSDRLTWLQAGAPTA